MWMILSGLLLHLIFLTSIFDIYFKSPIIHVNKNHASVSPAPAKRLVLFVADGLRAQSFFNYSFDPEYLIRNDTEVKYLKFVLANKAPWGISHTRVPTESRPGHVALIAGFYEDPSAVAKGWKENPVDFDSVLNQTQYAWCWGSPDILPIFTEGGNHIYNDMYDPNDVDFGKSETTQLDIWVFDKVSAVLRQARKNATLSQLLHENKIMFFLHLLGTDTAGHAFKPHSWEYINHINVVDRGVERVVELIEQFYGYDNQTAYIFTSDHGMTDWGSHGAGDPTETETPLIAWGAGMKTIPQFPSSSKKYSVRQDVMQADIAVLMASLIGVPIPRNSVGTLPGEYLSIPIKDKAEAYYANSKQIIEQFLSKRQEKEKMYNFKSFEPLENITTNQEIDEIKRLIDDHDYDGAILMSKHMIDLGLSGINFYQNFYQSALLLAITVSIVLWILFLLENILRSRILKATSARLDWCNTTQNYVSYVVYFVVIVATPVTCIFLNGLPYMYTLYFLLPQQLLLLLTKNINTWTKACYLTYHSTVRKNITLVLTVIFYLFVIECLVLVFFQRLILSFLTLLIALWMFTCRTPAVSRKLTIQWLISSIFLAIFPALPVIGSNANIILLALGGVAWMIAGTWLVLKDMHIPKNFIFEHINRNILFGMWQLLCVIAAVIIVLLIRTETVTTEHAILQRFSWILSVLSLLTPLCVSTVIVHRLKHVVLGMVAPFILLSVTYEPLFLLSFGFHLYTWLQIEHKLAAVREIKLRYTHTQSDLEIRTNMYKLESYSFDRTHSSYGKNDHRDVNNHDFRRAYFCLFYFLLSFFGTGNIASINSFDPTWVKCFVTVYRPFLMTTLILCKTIFPFIITSSMFYAVNIIVQAPFRKLLFTILVYCDITTIHFLYLVTNEGSWLEIGSSISHFVIIETTVLFIVLFYNIAVFYTGYSILRRENNDENMENL